MARNFQASSLRFRVTLLLMRSLLLEFLLALPLGLALSASASAQQRCDPAALPHAAQEVAEVQTLLSKAAVPENDPKVPGEIAAQLTRLKDALQHTARAAFACAPGDAEPETLQKTLGEALHAHTSPVASTIETRGNKDLGTYGADLSVQVFPLGGSPRYYEVDFRYGIECGDDNLLLVFASGGDSESGDDKPHDPAPWHQLLRWDAPRYNTVGDAFGDFILMTPLSGLPGQRNWRFVVAHGEPSCGSADAPSHFDLDLLEPALDSPRPDRVWHLNGGYLRSDNPQLSTTEDTLSFQLSPPKGRKQPGRNTTLHFHVTRDNLVQPLTGSDVPTATPTAADQTLNTRSPQ